MKKVISFVLTICVLLSSISFVFAIGPDPETEDLPLDEAHFPDECFRRTVGNYFDTNENGVISPTELENTNYIFLDAGIKSLKGIELLRTLEEIHFSWYNLPCVDLSKNTSLKYVAGYAEDGVPRNIILPNTGTTWQTEGFEDEVLTLPAGEDLCNLSGSFVWGATDKANILTLHYNNGNQDLTRKYMYFYGGDFEDFDNAFDWPENIDFVLWNDSADFSGGSYGGFLGGVWADSDLYAQVVTCDPEHIIRIDETNFPDPVFRQYVADHFDKYKNGVLSPYEIERINGLQLYYEDMESADSLESLQGIEYLTAITDITIWSFSNLKTVDLSSNTALKVIQVYGEDLELTLPDDGLDWYWNENYYGYIRLGLEDDFRKLSSRTVTIHGSTEYYRSDIKKELRLHNGPDEQVNYWSFSEYGNPVDFSLFSELFSIPSGYEYLLWNTKPDFTGCEYAETDFIELEEDMDLYAHWIPIDYEGSIEVNKANFPDIAFRQYIIDRLDTNHDGILTQRNISKITALRLSEAVRSLQGIEYFTELCTIVVDGSGLKTIDLSKNEKLLSVACSYNPRLESVVLPAISGGFVVSDSFEFYGENLNAVSGETAVSCGAIYAARKENVYSMSLHSNLDPDEVKFYNEMDRYTFYPAISDVFEIPAGMKFCGWEGGQIDGTGHKFEFYAAWAPEDMENCVEINEFNFPDPAFRDYLVNEFDENHDGILTEEQLLEARILRIDGYHIESFKGMEFFNSLDSIYLSNISGEALTLVNTRVDRLELSNVFFDQLDLSENNSIGLIEITASEIGKVKLSASDKGWLKGKEHSGLETDYQCCGEYSDFLSLGSGCFLNRDYDIEIRLHTDPDNLDYIDLYITAPRYGSGVRGYIPEGMVFAGWSTEPGGQGRILPNGIPEFYDDLYAIWEPEDVSGQMKINESNFPDRQLREYLEKNCDINHNGWLSTLEMPVIGEEYSEEFAAIKDYTGLEREYEQWFLSKADTARRFGLYFEQPLMSAALPAIQAIDGYELIGWMKMSAEDEVTYYNSYCPEFWSPNILVWYAPEEAVTIESQDMMIDGYAALMLWMVKSDSTEDAIVWIDGSGALNSHGSEYTVYDILRCHQDSFTVPECDFVKDGCTFMGYSLNPDGSGELIQPGDTMELPNAINRLYTVWEPLPDVNIFKAKYDSSGKMIEVKDVSYSEYYNARDPQYNYFIVNNDTFTPYEEE